MTIQWAEAPPVPPSAAADVPDRAGVVARRLVEAVAARDYGRLFDCLARDAHLRYLVPDGPGEVAGAADVAARYFDWFGDVDALEVREVLVRPVGDRTSARYHFRLREGTAWQLVEQQAYLDLDADGRVAAIDLVCSGFRPDEAAAAPGERRTHAFDAGRMGCSDGLAAEFRRRIQAIPVGDVLEVTARDPAAKEDLPSLARLMGHAVLGVEAGGDGRLTFTVERGR